ncbi:MAG: hypothetical protein AAGB51_01445 [Planctomycetota bacterium]
MELVGLMHVRDEQWVLGLSLPALLRFCDRVVLLDHGSTDRTPAIADKVAETHPDRLIRTQWEGRHYNEMGIRQKLLDTGREVGGTHFFMIDADEVLTGNLLSRVRGLVAELEPGFGLELPWPAMWGNPDRYRSDASVWSNNTKLFAYADEPSLGHRPHGDGYDMHHQAPRGLRMPTKRPLGADSDGGVMHLQFANRRRLVAKHAWYKMSETVRFPGREPAELIDRKYNQALDETGLGLAEAPDSWWAPYADLRSEMNLNDSPWHEAEVLRFWQEHGSEMFEGLELWGLPERLVLHADASRRSERVA